MVLKFRKIGKFIYVYVFPYCMTSLVLDSDSLIKLTKAGAKEFMVKHFQVIIPYRVKYESVDQAAGKPDAIMIEENIRAKKIEVIQTQKKDTHVENHIRDIGLKGGEQEVYRLSIQNEYDLLSSDDQKFLRLLQLLGKKAVTPASIIVLLYHNKEINREKANQLLQGLRSHISDEEYDLCMKEMEVKNDKHS